MDLHRCLGRSLALICTGLSAWTLLGAPQQAVAGPVVAGATTKGGLVAGTVILHVTTLADSGPGSLREALTAKGPRVIVFDVGGQITLANDLRIGQPYVTLAGQTAPSPGISLVGGSLRIRTHDVVIQHLEVRTGAGATPAENGNRDSISIDGNPHSPIDQQSFQVRLENVSVSWSVDEAVSLWYATTHNITVRHSIVAEALRNAGHPKGGHSMGLLVGQNVQAAEISGNLFVSNSYRNPVVGKGASAIVANNYTFNPGQNAIHFYDKGSKARTRATVVNNVIEAGLDTKPNLTGILVLMGKSEPADDQVFIDGNLETLGPKGSPAWTGPGLVAPRRPPVTGQNPILPTSEVKNDVLAHAGSRPADRNAIDRRIVSQVAAGAARIVDSPPDWPAPGEPTSGADPLPAKPFSLDPATGRTQLETWLCQKHLAVGGTPSADCPVTRKPGRWRGFRQAGPKGLSAPGRASEPSAPDPRTPR